MFDGKIQPNENHSSIQDILALIIFLFRTLVCIIMCFVSLSGIVEEELQIHLLALMFIDILIIRSIATTQQATTQQR